MTISTTKLKQNTATYIDNSFIDNYMAHANGEYVKVYLYIVRHADEELTDDKIADALELTVRDVNRAYAYWAKLGLLEEITEKDDEGSDTGHTSLIDLQDDEEFSSLLYVVQRYLGKTFTGVEAEKFAYLYNDLKLPSDLIEYLVEICVQKGHASVRYIESVAIQWHKKGIRTVDEAKQDAEIYRNEMNAVMGAFGIRDRALGDAEKEYISVWFGQYGFDCELVREACSRALAATSKPSFKYADSILKRWYDGKVRNLADVEALDKEHEKNQVRGQMNFFNNYNQGNYANNTHSNSQYDAIMREYDDLLRKEKAEAEARKAFVYETIPRIRELDDRIKTVSVSNVRRALAGEDKNVLAKELEDIKAEKAQLLEEAGLEPDYMQIRYTCADCRDTGLIDGRKCHCFIEKEKRFR